MERKEVKEIERFNIIERLQHVILLCTFLLVAFTGWALKYPDVGEYSSWWIKIWGGAKKAGIIHRVAGVIMVLDFIWHAIYMAYRILTGRIKIRAATTVIPLPKDVFDAIKNFLYFLGLGKEKPQFGRFTYAQKFDYWAVFWGMGIIGLSGLCLAFPVQASYFFPSWSLNWIWETIAIMHSDEALLAIVFILIFHFYNEHFKFHVFPMSMIWITGKISVDLLKEEHPLEYEILKKEGKVD